MGVLLSWADLANQLHAEPLLHRCAMYTWEEVDMYIVATALDATHLRVLRLPTWGSGNGGECLVDATDTVRSAPTFCATLPG